MLPADQSLRASTALKNLPPFPPVAAKVADLITDEGRSLKRIADILKTDAALSAEVLRLANSPLVNVRYEIKDVLQALGLLGVRRVQSLIMTLGLSRFLAAAGRSEAMRRLWRHNLACAVAARALAKDHNQDPNEAYYAGLFHDIGRLALLVLAPGPYDKALAEGRDMDEFERVQFGVDHCEAGAWVIEKWRLPRAFIEVALEHHKATSQNSGLTILIHDSCEIAGQLGYSLLPVNEGEVEFEPTSELGFAVALAVNAWECEFGV